MSASNPSSLESFFTHLQQVQPVSAALRAALEGVIVEESFPPRALLLEAGEVCKRVYYLSSGLARGFYRLNGEEITCWLLPEGNWMVAISSFFTQEPSEEYIEFLETTSLLSIDYAQLQALYQQFPEFNFTGRLLTERYYGEIQKHGWMLRRQTAYERFQHLRRTQPQLLDRVPRKYIASFLGMTAETMSRLRKKDKKDSKSGSAK